MIREELSWENRLTKIETYMKVNLGVTAIMASYVFGIKPVFAAMGVVLP